jgi:hypothetical protein
MALAARTGDERISTRLRQYYVAVNAILAPYDDSPAVIPAVNDLSWHTALVFSLFTTYHVTNIES